MTVVIRAERSLKNLEVDKSIRMWTPAAMTKIGQLKNLRSLTLTARDLAERMRLQYLDQDCISFSFHCDCVLFKLQL